MRRNEPNSTGTRCLFPWKDAHRTDLGQGALLPSSDPDASRQRFAARRKPRPSVAFSADGSNSPASDRKNPLKLNTLGPRLIPAVVFAALIGLPGCGGTTPAGPTGQPLPTPTPTPLPARVVLGTGTFNDEAPNPDSSATNSFFAFETQAGRMDVRATWGTSSLVRLYIYAGTCSAPRIEAGDCGTVLGSVEGRTSPAFLGDVGVPDGTITLRFENLGVGPTGPGTWEAGLVRY